MMKTEALADTVSVQVEVALNAWPKSWQNVTQMSKIPFALTTRPLRKEKHCCSFAHQALFGIHRRALGVKGQARMNRSAPEKLGFVVVLAGSLLCERVSI